MPHPMMNSHARRETRESRRERRLLSGMIGAGVGAGAALSFLYPTPARLVFGAVGIALAAVLAVAASFVVVAQMIGAIRIILSDEKETPFHGVSVACSEVYPADFATREEYEDFKRTSKYTFGEDVIPAAIEEYKEEIERREASAPRTRMGRVSRMIQLEIETHK